MQSNRRGRVEIGRQARLRIWCREAYGFDSLRPHSRKVQQSAELFLFSAIAEKQLVRLLAKTRLRGIDFTSIVKILATA